MDKFYCSQCGREHRLSDIEPSFDRPDAFFDIPASERAKRTFNEPDLCVLWETEDMPRRHFLRVLLPIPIRGEARDYCWGVWVEVAEADFASTHDRWNDPRRAEMPPFGGKLANELPGMPSTLGFEGTVRVSPPGEIPRFMLVPQINHPLAHQQREGIFREQAIEWASLASHQ